MGRAVFSPCRLVWGQTMVGVMAVMATSIKRLYANMHGSQDCCIQCLWPLGRPLSTLDCRRPLDTHRQAWLSLLWGHCSFLLGRIHKVLFVPSKSLFPQPCGSFVIKPHWPSKSEFPGGSQSLCCIPRLGSLLWALELSIQCKNFFGIIVLQFVGHLLGSSVVGLMATSSQRTYVTHCAPQVCCSQSPCPCRRPLLTRAPRETLNHSKAGLAQSLWVSPLLSLGPGMHKVLSELPKHLW